MHFISPSVHCASLFSVPLCGLPLPSIHCLYHPFTHSIPFLNSLFLPHIKRTQSLAPTPYGPLSDTDRTLAFHSPASGLPNHHVDKQSVIVPHRKRQLCRFSKSCAGAPRPASALHTPPTNPM